MRLNKSERSGQGSAQRGNRGVVGLESDGLRGEEDSELWIRDLIQREGRQALGVFGAENSRTFLAGRFGQLIGRLPRLPGEYRRGEGQRR